MSRQPSIVELLLIAGANVVAEDKVSYFYVAFLRVFLTQPTISF